MNSNQERHFRCGRLLCFYLPHSEGMGKVLFSQVWIYPQRGTPSPSHNTSIHWSHILSGGTQCLVPCPFLRGIPWNPQWGWLPHRVPNSGYPSQVRMGYPQVRTGWGAPRTYPFLPSQVGVGAPCMGDRAVERVLATRLAVCLLRSRRSTFLFLNLFQTSQLLLNNLVL